MRVILGTRTAFGELDGTEEFIEISEADLQAKLDNREWYECDTCEAEYRIDKNTRPERIFHTIHPDDLPGVDTRWLHLVGAD